MALPLAWATGWLLGTGARLALKTGGAVIARPVLSLGGAILGWELFDIGGTKIGGWVESEIGDIFAELRDDGIQVISTGIESGTKAAGETVVETIEKAGPALLTGIENTFIAIRESLRGREVAWVTVLTVVVITLLAGRFLWNTSRTAGMTVFDDSI